MVEEARLEQRDAGLTPVTDGWFVVDVRDGTTLALRHGAGVDRETRVIPGVTTRDAGRLERIAMGDRARVEADSVLRSWARAVSTRSLLPMWLRSSRSFMPPAVSERVGARHAPERPICHK